MLHNQNGGLGLFLNLVDQVDGLFAGGRVQVGQRFVKQQNFYLVHHNARQTDPLLLSAGKFMGRIAQMLLHADKLRRLLNDVLHFLLRNTVVLQRKSDVLSHGQADELSVRILQHRADALAQGEDAFLLRLHAVHRQASGGCAGITEGNQTVDAAHQRAFAAAAGSGNQYLFPRINVQVDMAKGRLRLGAVLKAEIPKGDDGFHGRTSDEQNERQMKKREKGRPPAALPFGRAQANSPEKRRKITAPA